MGYEIVATCLLSAIHVLPKNTHCITIDPPNQGRRKVRAALTEAGFPLMEGPAAAGRRPARRPDPASGSLLR